MMVLFLDIDKQKISLYGEEGIVNIPFSQAGQLYNHIENSSVLYITNAIQTNAKEVVKMIKNMGVDVKNDIPEDTGIRYICSPSEGTISIDEFLKFEGKFDIKMIDKSMKQTIESSDLLQQLIKNKRLKVIGEIEKRKLLEEFKKYQDSKMKKQQKIEDDIDSIIVKKSVAEAVEEGIYNNNNNNNDGAIEIDILARGPVEGSNFNTMSELLNEVDGFEE